MNERIYKSDKDTLLLTSTLRLKKGMRFFLKQEWVPHKSGIGGTNFYRLIEPDGQTAHAVTYATYQRLFADSDGA